MSWVECTVWDDFDHDDEALSRSFTMSKINLVVLHSTRWVVPVGSYPRIGWEYPDRPTFRRVYDRN